MLNGSQVVAAIPARGGSKGVPRKNLRELGGKPLVAWPIKIAKEVQSIDKVVVTTDDDEIAETARDYGAEVVKRPAELAKDDSIVITAIRHLIGTLKEDGHPVDYLVILEPTSPLRLPEDVNCCLRRLATEELDSVATFTEADPNPHRTWRLVDGQPEPFITTANPWVPRQQLPEAYELNGAVYAFRTDKLSSEGASPLVGQAGAVTMPAERSIDIDREIDFTVAESLLDERHD